MFQNLNLFQAAGGLARHAANRQSMIARNLANADTPGYQARDLAPFVNSFERTAGTQAAAPKLRVSNPKHLMGLGGHNPNTVEIRTSQEKKPNGNTVSIEEETLKSVEAERAHTKALAVYQHTLTLLKTSIGRGR